MNTNWLASTFVIPLYDIEVIVYFSEHMEEPANDLKVVYDIDINYRNNERGAKALKASNTNGDVKFVLIYAIGKLQHYDVNDIIAHEALHMSWYLCDYLGIKIDGMNHEAQAYILENIVNQVTKFKDKYFEV